MGFSVIPPTEHIKSNIETAISFNSYYNESIPLDLDLQYVIYTECLDYNIDYYLVVGLIQNESNFKSDVVNNKTGCYGLMQLNPEYFDSGLSPEDNIRQGIEYLSYCIDYCDGDIDAGLCMYGNGYDTGDRKHSKRVKDYADYWKNLKT